MYVLPVINYIHVCVCMCVIHVVFFFKVQRYNGQWRLLLMILQQGCPDCKPADVQNCRPTEATNWWFDTLWHHARKQNVHACAYGGIGCMCALCVCVIVCSVYVCIQVHTNIHVCVSGCVSFLFSIECIHGVCSHSCISVLPFIHSIHCVFAVCHSCCEWGWYDDTLKHNMNDTQQTHNE
jgi:hypothetical protein